LLALFEYSRFHFGRMTNDVNPSRPFDPRLFLVDQELDRSVGLILSGARALAQVAEEARSAAGLSKAELQILLLIRYEPQLTVSAARAALSMTVPTFARLIGELDARGLIARERGAGDGRRRRLALSDAGTTLTTPITIAVRDRLRQAFRIAGPDSVAGARLLLEALHR
jgi:DNA-binding MarR family transcriptional regulator